MAETSYFWGGTTTGDHGAYTDDHFSDVLRKLFSYDRTIQGVVKGYGSDLIVTNSSGVVIRMAIGAALVDGKFYESTANVDNSISAPGAGFNYYTLVLKKDFTLQTVRCTLLGPDAVAYPSIVQNEGIEWDLMIAQIKISSVGAITITDQRNNLTFNTEIVARMIADGIITAAKLHPDVFPYTNVGDLAVGVSSSHADKLVLGTALYILRVNGAGTGLEYASIASILSVDKSMELEIEDSVPPLSGEVGAGLSISESSGAGTDKPMFWILSFLDSATNQRAWLNRVVPRGYTNTLVLKVHYYMSGANASKSAVFTCKIASIKDTDSGVTAKVYDTVNNLTVVVPDTAGVEDTATIPLTNADGIVIGSRIDVLLGRTPLAGADDAAGIVIVTAVELQWA
jgi:hypothetical protein